MNHFQSQLIAVRDALKIPEVKHDPYLVLVKPQTSSHRINMVTNTLPAPTECPHCKGSVGLYLNSKIYHGRLYGKWPYVYLCENDACASYVGLHPETLIPLGTLANDAMREARTMAKLSFNILWESGEMTRTEAYAWLAAKMNIPVERCHIGWFDEQECYRVCEICDEHTMPA